MRGWLGNWPSYRDARCWENDVREVIMPDDTREPDRERTGSTSLSGGVIAAAEGFIVAAISAVGYIFAFVYEAGFAKVFSIPLSFIAVSLTNVLIVAGSLLLVGNLVFSTANLVFTVSDRFNGPISKRVKLLMPVLLYSMALALVAAGTRLLSKAIIGLMIGWLISIFFEFIFPLLTQRGKGSYQEKLVAQDELDARTRGSDLYGLLARRFGVGPYNLVLSLLMALVVIYFAGQSEAMRQSRYLVTSTSPEMVVLRIYGDKMICAPIDRDSGEIEPRFTVLKVADDPELVLQLEEVGPLDVVSKASGSLVTAVAIPGELCIIAGAAPTSCFEGVP